MMMAAFLYIINNVVVYFIDSRHFLLYAPSVTRMCVLPYLIPVTTNISQDDTVGAAKQTVCQTPKKISGTVTNTMDFLYIGKIDQNGSTVVQYAYDAGGKLLTTTGAR